MREYLVYWKYRWDDELDLPGQFGWASASKRFYDGVGRGDALWVVVPGGPDHPDEWRVLERIVVSRKDIDPEGDDNYGRYIFKGDPKKSERFHPDRLPDFTPVLKSLDFASGKRIGLDGALIGRALQTQRPLADADPPRIRRYVKGPRGRR